MPDPLWLTAPEDHDDHRSCTGFRGDENTDLPWRLATPGDTATKPPEGPE
jgi:hypothetical protein